MTKGNGQKSFHARLAKQAKMKDQDTRTPEEKKAARAKQTKDGQALKCEVCKAPFIATTGVVALRDHAETRHPNVPVDDCFPKLKELVELEAEEAAEAAAEAALVVAEENRRKSQAALAAKESMLTAELAAAKAELAAELTAAKAELAADRLRRCRLSTAEELTAGFMEACHNVEGLEEGAADADLIAAVGQAMADALEAHQLDGCVDATELYAGLELSCSALLSAFLTEEQAEGVIFAVLKPLKVDAD